MWDEYVPVYDTMREHIEWYNAETKACELLKQRWGMLAQGYYLVLLNNAEVAAENMNECNCGEDCCKDECNCDKESCDCECKSEE
jgi:hypothetical protein